MELTIEHMKEKVDTGADFFITQLFFENANFYRFRERIEAVGVNTPIIVGVMPVLQAQQIQRIVKLSGAAVPPKLEKILLRYADKPAEMELAGIEYAIEQINDLMENNVAGIHLYTMNKVNQTCQIIKRAGLLNTV